LSADLHYANFDERPAGGRRRFHDQASLERLQAIKAKVDPAGLFTGSHALTAGSSH
jgi:FAD/FMN-containing dehydrogenase